MESSPLPLEEKALILYSTCMCDKDVELTAEKDSAFRRATRTTSDILEEGGDDVKSPWPLCAGPHTCYNGNYNGKQGCKAERIRKDYLSSDCSLQLGNMKLESLVIANQHAAVNMYPGPCTHRPSHPEIGFARSIGPMITHDFCGTLVATKALIGLIGAYHSGVFDWGEVMLKLASTGGEAGRRVKGHVARGESKNQLFHFLLVHQSEIKTNRALRAKAETTRTRKERMIKRNGLLTGSAPHHSYMTDLPGASGSAGQEVLQGIPVHEIFPDKDIWEDILTHPFYCSPVVHIPGEIVDPLTISKLTHLNHFLINMRYDFMKGPSSRLYPIPPTGIEPNSCGITPGQSLGCSPNPTGTDRREPQHGNVRVSSPRLIFVNGVIRRAALSDQGPGHKGPGTIQVRRTPEVTAMSRNLTHGPKRRANTRT
ncbi:hypothetical protein HAX54_024761 [Datura stramonium]|uniref:U-box domain-containing protein n=1 Tax=Datura stramonium TaxID=4076 RepID=A0ABS8S673_DATST|nr:hypothetical protein [Datura stramonium]